MQRRTPRNLWNDDRGLVVSIELILIVTIGVLMLVVGLHAVTRATNHELGDIAGAIGAADQSYTYDGFVNPRGVDGNEHAAGAGTAYRDEADDCDCAEIREITPTAKPDGAQSGLAENE